jgi:hypothetical protein
MISQHSELQARQNLRLLSESHLEYLTVNYLFCLIELKKSPRSPRTGITGGCFPVGVRKPEKTEYKFRKNPPGYVSSECRKGPNGTKKALSGKCCENSRIPHETCSPSSPVVGTISHQSTATVNFFPKRFV